jgi:ketosteroid isomerase-like protein
MLRNVMVSTVERSHKGFEGLDSLAPDVEIDVSELPDGRILRGREPAEDYWRSLLTDVWAELTMDVEAIFEQDGTVVALARFHGVGRGSSVPVEMEVAWVVTMRDGLVASARLTLDRQLALQAGVATA